MLHFCNSAHKLVSFAKLSLSKTTNKGDLNESPTDWPLIFACIVPSSVVAGHREVVAASRPAIAVYRQSPAVDGSVVGGDGYRDGLAVWGGVAGSL
jgi:hypothetical protein